MLIIIMFLLAILIFSVIAVEKLLGAIKKQNEEMIQLLKEIRDKEGTS
ncbi:hypothetical protein [Lysinibacillus sp. LZ02]